MTITKHPWWKDAVVYQVWPASFKDGNGDGIGDLKGLLESLDYIKDLGANVIWLCPHYESPQDDMGYDISDYNQIDPRYGTLEEMVHIIDEIHQRGMKIIFDLVINHTSSEHAWFKESRSSLDNSKRDWYIWKKPRYDANGVRRPPNNWGSHFSGSAWEYDELTGEYYLRLFARTQPDLNWENKETRNAIYDVALDFWYKRGVDGFRIDTAGLYSKKNFDDAPIVIPGNEFQPSFTSTNNGPRIHEYHKEMFQKTSSKYDVMTVGEVGFCPREETLQYVSAKEKEMNMIFLFDPVEVGYSPVDRFDYKGYKLPELKDAVLRQSSFTKGTDAWSTAFIENHDQARSVSRFGSTENPLFHNKSAKVLAILQATLTGTLFLLQGQEIGMTNLPRSWDIKEYLDINTINYWKAWNEKHPNASADDKKKVLDGISITARDHARSPVQWDSSINGGFSTGKPWTRVNDNYKTINVASQVNDPDSILSFWRKALKLRSEYSNILVHGDLEILDHDNQNTFSYLKSGNGKAVYVILNFSADEQKFEPVRGELELLLSNYKSDQSLSLAPWEGRVYAIN